MEHTVIDKDSSAKEKQNTIFAMASEDNCSSRLFDLLLSERYKYTCFIGLRRSLLVALGGIDFQRFFFLCCCCLLVLPGLALVAKSESASCWNENMILLA